MAAKAMQRLPLTTKKETKCDVGRIIRQVWPGSWEHRIKCFWGRILSQINLKGQDGQACDVCRAGIGKSVLIWQGRPLLAATLNSASWSLSRASKPACAALKTRQSEVGESLAKHTKRAKGAGTAPTTIFVRQVTVLCPSDKLQAGWKERRL